MRIAVGTAVLLLCSSIAVSAQQTPKTENRESRALKDSCATYIRIKDDNISISKWNAEDSAAVGFCKGYFRGFMSASTDVLTEPDETGHIKEFKIVEGTTYDQAIRGFLIVVEEKPELLANDAGVIIMATLQAGGLATYKDKAGVYVRKQ